MKILSRFMKYTGHGKKLCQKYGCNIQTVHTYDDSLVLICHDCGHKFILNVYEGVHDKLAEAFICRRSLIQPRDRQAWEDCYGYTKYGRLLNGESVSQELSYEEEQQFAQDARTHNKAVEEFEKTEAEMAASLT
jgi:hypothetical protein